MSVGWTLGYANHFGKTSEVDGTTSATVLLPDQNISDSGLATGLRLDFGLIPLSRSDIGLSMDILASFPDFYFDFIITPKYRLNFSADGPLSAVEPWLGVPLAFTVPRGTNDFFFAFGGAIGCDLGLAGSPWRVGLGVFVNAVNPKPVRKTQEIEGYQRNLESRLDNVLVLFNASYVFFTD
jgi:hypothetical protein